MSKTYMTKKEVADFAKVCTKTVEEWMRTGLAYIQIDKVIRIDKDDLDSFLEAHRE